MLLREDAGGGSRVSAATMEGPWSEAHLDSAPLWRVREGEEALDAALEARGFAVRDPVRSWWAPADRLAPDAPPRMTGFAVWPPVALMRDIWARGGIGAPRLAVMARAPGPRTGILARVEDRPAGVAFVAAAGPVAGIHAIEVVPALRRRGAGLLLLRHAAWWARRHGALHVALYVTEANGPANALYARMGMSPGPRYHYRVMKEP